nr:ATP-dependent zinc metalloprotease FTSH 11, chloroplastic/mitochondrial-like [Tanacetum cinerariifolium]
MRLANVVEHVGATSVDSNHIGTSVSTQCKRTRQDSQVGSSSCEANVKTFKDFKGCDDAKHELKEVVEYLTHLDYTC